MVTAILNFSHVSALYTNIVTRNAYRVPNAPDSVTVNIPERTPPTIITAVNKPGNAVMKCKNNA